MELYHTLQSPTLQSGKANCCYQSAILLDYPKNCKSPIISRSSSLFMSAGTLGSYTKGPVSDSCKLFVSKLGDGGEASSRTNYVKIRVEHRERFATFAVIRTLLTFWRDHILMVMSPKDSNNDRQKHHRVKENFRTKTQKMISTSLNKLLRSEISVENHSIKM